METRLQSLYDSLEKEKKRDLDSYWRYGDKSEEKKKEINRIKKSIKIEKARIKERFGN
tara:strand:+ start:186 stop:359 length:174 start_codon:yes stop_codon:yes gene_type:complete